VGSYSYRAASPPTATASSEWEIARHLRVDASELRARAARYRHLALSLIDPQVTTEVYACARELDAKAAGIDNLVAFEMQTMSRARAEAIQLADAASFRGTIPPLGTSGPRWIINTWCDL
jgi:hypothetical protein